MSRVLGVDRALLPARAAAAATRIEDELRDGLALPGRGGWWDAHVHLGRDADGHELDAPGLLADMDRWGIAVAVIFPPNDPGADGQFTAANVAVLDAAGASRGRLLPFCRLDPRGDWAPHLDRWAAAGVRGVKLHPVAQGFRPESAGCVALVREAAAHGLPVLLHAGYGARPLAEPIARLCEGAPEARLLLAHAGRGDARALAALARGNGRISFDTSLAALPDVVDLPPERLCLGSDRPYGEHASALRLVALAARVAGWSDAQLGGVLGGNLRTILAA